MKLRDDGLYHVAPRTTRKTMSSFENHWFEIWSSHGFELPPTWLLIVASDKAVPGRVLVYDPQEKYRIVHSGNYESVREWLAEDEFVPVKGRVFPDDGFPLHRKP